MCCDAKQRLLLLRQGIAALLTQSVKALEMVDGLDGSNSLAKLAHGGEVAESAVLEAGTLGTLLMQWRQIGEPGMSKSLACRHSLVSRAETAEDKVLGCVGDLGPVFGLELDLHLDNLLEERGLILAVEGCVATEKGVGDDTA